MNMSLQGTQIGVLAPGALPQQSRIIGYDKMLRMKALITDIWSKLSGIYDPATKTIPAGIYMKVDERVTADALEAVITI